MSLADEAALKRLLFEGHTMVLSQLREAVANPEAAHTRKLPQVERNAKMVTLRAAMPGVCIEKQLEPSHALLDLVSPQFEAQQLAYLSPDRCTSREWEVAMGKTSKQIQLDTDHLVVKEKSDTRDQVAATEMQIYEALRRRGIAYAFADWLDWTVHERYISQLFGHLREDPPQGYVKTSIQQLLRADRAVWAKIIEDNVSVRRDATGLRPLDAAVPAALHSPEIAFHLVPLPKPIQQPKNEWKVKQWGKDDDWKNKQWNKWQPYDPKKAKRKGKGARTNMMAKVFKHKDCVSVDHHGRRLCFGYNLKKCSQVSDGAQCNHGWHLCLRKGCHAPHPEAEHDNDKPPDPRQWGPEPPLNRLENLNGKEIYEALVIEIFCATGRVTACLRQFGLSSSFGVDHIRPRNCVAPVALVDLTTKRGRDLLEDGWKTHELWECFWRRPVALQVVHGQSNWNVNVMHQSHFVMMTIPTG